MIESKFFKKYDGFLNFLPNKYGKLALFENEHMVVGLNCLEPGQVMEKHSHEDQSRFYIVMEGSAHVWVGNEENDVEPGTVIWVPPNNFHRIMNSGLKRMVLLVGFTEF